MKTRVVALLIASLLALVATTVLASCGAGREAPRHTPPNVALGAPVSVVGGGAGAPGREGEDHRDGGEPDPLPACQPGLCW